MHLIDYIFPFKITRISDKDKDINYTNQFLGFNKHYKANQNNMHLPFEEGYANSGDVYAIVNKIARSAKTIPWVLKKKTGDVIEDVTDGQLYDIIKNPNSNQDTESFVEECLIHLLISGNNYLYTDVGLGLVGAMATPNSVEAKNPQIVEIISEFVGQNNTVKGYKYHINGKDFPLLAENVTHVKYINPTMYGINYLYGLSPLISGYLTLKGLINNQTAHASILDNQGASGILSNDSGVALSPDDREIQQKLFDKKNSGAVKFGKIIQSMTKVTYTKLGLDPTELKIIESKTLKMRDLCNIYDVSSVLFNDPQNRIQANLTPAETAFWRNAVIPNLNKVVYGFTKAIVDKYNEAEYPNGESKYYIELDKSQIQALQKNEKEKAEKARMKSEAIVNVLTSGMTPQQQISTLQISLEITEQEAQQIVGRNE